MSLPEVLLWQVLRRRPEGLKFRRQFPIGPITVDFACLERRLFIEVDGEGHSYGDQPRRDAARDALLRREGFRVVRIAARDVLKDMDAVARYIVAEAKSSPERRGGPAKPVERTQSSPERRGGPAKPVERTHASTREAIDDDMPRPTAGPLHHDAARRGPPPRSGEDREDL